MRMRRLRMTSRAFEKVATIGKGAFGKVMLVRMRGTNQLFAMKKLRKGKKTKNKTMVATHLLFLKNTLIDEMVKKDQVKHVRAERDVLAESNTLYANQNPWITRLFYSFQDKDYL
jgi:serine/threonine protein kinase